MDGRRAEHLSFAIHGRDAHRRDRDLRQAWSTLRRLDGLGYHLITRAELRRRLIALEVCSPEDADELSRRLLPR